MIPNFLADVEQAKKDFPQDWDDAHTGNANTEGFIRKLGARIHAKDARIALNGKRGNPEDISDDALCFKGEGSDWIEENGVRIPASVIDVIGAAGSPSATPQWNVVSSASNPIKTAWVTPGTVVQPPHVCPPPFVPGYEDLGGDAGFRADIGVPLQADMAQAGQSLNDGSSVWFSRPIFECIAECVKQGKIVDRAPIIKKYRNQWRAILGLPSLP